VKETTLFFALHTCTILICSIGNLEAEEKQKVVIVCMGSGMECYENLRGRATWKQFNMKCNYQIRLSWKEHGK
jgi:hypothetical protein